VGQDDGGRGDGAGGGVVVPEALQLAWGRRERPTRGPKRGLSLDGIVAAGVAVAATEGLASVSMQRVATELGTAPMSLYRYVESKEQLLRLMVDAAYGDPPRTDPGAGWRDAMSRWAWAMRAALARNVWAVRVPISGAPTLPHEVAWMEGGLAALAGTRLREGEKMSTILLVSTFVRSEVTLGVDVGQAFAAAGQSDHEAMSSYGRLLAELAEPQRFPAIRAVIDDGVFDVEDDPDDEFRFGLDRMLDGLDVLVRQRRRNP
jgi:AcrR family transcriptional regulator